MHIRVPALARPRVSTQDMSHPGEGADRLWSEHGWALKPRHVSLIVLVVLALSALGALSDWAGLPLLR